MRSAVLAFLIAAAGALLPVTAQPLPDAAKGDQQRHYRFAEAERWAAIAPMSGVLPKVDYQLPRLKNVPVHISIGGKENPARVLRGQSTSMKDGIGKER
jgi:hypothetical protein